MRTRPGGRRLVRDQRDGVLSWSRADYDRWAAIACPWAYAHVLPYFRRAESWEVAPTQYRGDSGPLSAHYTISPTVCEAFIEAGAAPAIRRPPTTTAASRKASAAIQMTIRGPPL